MTFGHCHGCETSSARQSRHLLKPSVRLAFVIELFDVTGSQLLLMFPDTIHPMLDAEVEVFGQFWVHAIELLVSRYRFVARRLVVSVETYIFVDAAQSSVAIGLLRS